MPEKESISIKELNTLPPLWARDHIHKYPLTYAECYDPKSMGWFIPFKDWHTPSADDIKAIYKHLIIKRF